MTLFAREGNGRLARLLALLMVLQAGLPPLDFSPLSGRGKRGYIAGIRAAMGGDYAALAAMFARVIERSRRRAASQWAIKASVLLGVWERLPFAKGARIPSTADDVCAEMRRAACRARMPVFGGLMYQLWLCC